MVCKTRSWKAENVSAPSFEDMFRYTYKEMTAELKEELDYLKKVKNDEK